MSEDTEYLKRIYPENFPPATIIDWILAIFIISLFFIVPYLYARFVEPKLVIFIYDRLVPFLIARLHLRRTIDFIGRILNTPLFKSREKRS